MAKIQDEQFLHSDLILYTEPELYDAEEQRETQTRNKSNDLIFSEVGLNITHYSKKESEIEVVSVVSEKPLSPVLPPTQTAESSAKTSQNRTYGFRRCGRLSEY
ncbi:hypothetical protein G7B40_018290 [Aetokthonos hydrillicola Thurmond2011]|jgi:hypothetical protein|uniref:Uncharacterized protein n=1 Tax=Aetokthonos hydrillicola Thurmond2011 TaxID=2712845 RepID=A0AAP5MB78_9CYAN|nr:hypothetical protein [Aetokthonos hydrillicola]MBO3460350.1 hypothetical protein [Aetokthonos hydrillicola CCALA 1050]MBW4588384.1 hypothetical protein [Aetokthonos hydrillicola CCALA 1050]MDR9896494.1 hypothetical protein [Aetokthonos hydrillicola Thurmond2011]